MIVEGAKMVTVVRATTGDKLIKSGVLYTLSFRLPGPDHEDEIILAAWTGEIDTWGKLTFSEHGTGQRHYLFPHEVTEIGPWEPGEDES